MAAALLRTALACALRPLLRPGRCPAALLPGPAAAIPAGSWPLPGPPPAAGFKTKGVLRKRCRDCYRVKRRGRWFIYCKTNPRHKQRQL